MTQKTWGFFITTYCTKQEHLDSLIRCVESIIKFHSDKLIVIIDDFSELDTNIFTYENVKWVHPPYKSAEMAGYATFYNNKYFDVCISLQDSVILKKALPDLSDIDCKTVWSFPDYLNLMDGIEISYSEPVCQYNSENNVITHGDLICHLVEKNCPDCEFKEYFECMYSQPKKWLGSCGSMLIISWNFLFELEERTHILEIAKAIGGNRRQRMAMESIIGIAIKYVKRWTKWEDYCFDVDIFEECKKKGDFVLNDSISEYFYKYNFSR